VAAAVLRALDADPQKRWPDAAAFAAALSPAPTRIAAPGWTIARVEEPPAPVYEPRRAPRFMVESRPPQPGFVAGAGVAIFLVLALGWIATH
jgi:hypothetical protein